MKTIKSYLDKAKEKLGNAEEFISKSKFNDIPYFIYYSFFYLMHALLLTKKNEIKNYPSSHGGLKKLFSYYFPELRNFIPFIEKAYSLRYKSDYELTDMRENKEEIIELYNKALEFYEKVVGYLKEKGFIEGIKQNSEAQ